MIFNLLITRNIEYDAVLRKETLNGKVLKLPGEIVGIWQT